MPAISRIPLNLNPEEKLAFVRERNRLKTQRLRARRKEKIQEEQQLVSSRERESLERGGAGESSGSSSSPSRESEEREEEEKGRPGIKVRKLMGINEAEKEVELELVVERMKRKLVELGVGEEVIRRMLTGCDEPLEEGSCSIDSIDEGHDLLSISTSSPSTSASSSPSSPPSSSSPTSLSDSVAFFGGETWWTRQPFPSSSPMLPLDTDWRSTLFSMHREALLSYRMGAISHDQTTASDSTLASMQISILRLLAAVSGSESQTAYKSSTETIPPTPDVFEYLASHPIDERLMLVPSGPVTKMRVSKAVASGTLDISSVIGEVILSAVIRGNVFDLSGWTLSSSFWTTFRVLPKPPRENVFEARPVDVDGGPMSPFPADLRGSSIQEIVLGTERPNSRTRGPFPLQGLPPQQRCIVASSS